MDPEGIVITKHGKPIARLVPIEGDSRALIGSLKGKYPRSRVTFAPPGYGGMLRLDTHILLFALTGELTLDVCRAIRGLDFPRRPGR